MMNLGLFVQNYENFSFDIKNFVEAIVYICFKVNDVIISRSGLSIDDTFPFQWLTDS